MSINLIITSKDFKRQQEIGLVDDLFIKRLRAIDHKDIQLLKSISIYEKTYFNRLQLKTLSNELRLALLLNQEDKIELTILAGAVNDVLNNIEYDFLVFIGD